MPPHVVQPIVGELGRDPAERLANHPWPGPENAAKGTGQPGRCPYAVSPGTDRLGRHRGRPRLPGEVGPRWRDCGGPRSLGIAIASIGAGEPSWEPIDGEVALSENADPWRTGQYLAPW
jgi:hypothetical protein